METDWIVVPMIVGILAGGMALGVAWYASRRLLRRVRSTARAILTDARAEADSRQKEILVAAQERILAQQEEADKRERELDDREAASEQRSRDLDRMAAEVARERAALQRRSGKVERLEAQAQEADAAAQAARDEAARSLQRIAGLTAEEARAELIRDIEDEARSTAARVARKIEDTARENAEREAVNLMVQASQRVDIRDVVESTVSFIELPSDEMKGRIIGREGRNIRSLEMATGIDLIVDDTPRSILISSFDPLRREVARVAIDRLVEDGRIHPARIEEVVQRVRDEIETLIDEKGVEAAYTLGISEVHPKLIRLVGTTRYRTIHGQNLLQHCVETAMIAGHLALEVGARADVVLRAGLLHEVGQVGENSNNPPLLASADLCAKYGEPAAVVDCIRALHPGVEAVRLEELLLRTANKMSDNRPGARKENLAVFIERLRRLESIATSFHGVDRAFAVKAGKEIRVIIDAAKASDDESYELTRKIARAIERELSYPGQIKVSVVRATRAIRYAV